MLALHRCTNCAWFLRLSRAFQPVRNLEVRSLSYLNPRLSHLANFSNSPDYIKERTKISLPKTGQSLLNPPNVSFQGRRSYESTAFNIIPSSKQLSIDEKAKVEILYKGLCNGERSALARSITLVESVNDRNKLQAQYLLRLVLEREKKQKRYSVADVNTFRIGLSGPPGAGKSTFIESFGKLLTSLNHKVAVLAVDPSSATTGGSLLGDKTRMPDLTVDPNAYIRPSPAGGNLGGVTRNTSDTIVLAEGAGYDIILVETVGVGQSEFAVANMVDMFILLIPPAGGDELQGIKKGIVEEADLVVVNKSDGDLVAAARRTTMEYVSALKFVRRKKKWRAKVMRVSSLTKEGLPELWKEMGRFRDAMVNSGALDKRRNDQQKVWMWNQISSNIMGMFCEHPAVQPHIKNVENLVSKSVITPGQAADYLLEHFTEKKS